MPFDTRQYYRTSCNTSPPIIKTMQGQRYTFQLTLRQDDGTLVNLETIGLRESEGSSSSATNEMTVALAYGTTYADSPLFTTDGEIKQVGDTDVGLVSFTLEPEHAVNSGLFVGSIGVFRDSVLVFARSVMIEFAPNSFNTASCGQLTVAEVRMDLMDTCAGANYLLDELEYTDAEIVHCIKKAVDVYNELPPPVGGFTYNNFPFRAHWLKGTVGFLLQSIGNRYRRNALQYSAGGMTVSDQEKSQEYTGLGLRMEAEYVDWAKTNRVGRNMASGFGQVGASTYRWSGR